MVSLIGYRNETTFVLDVQTVRVQGSVEEVYHNQERKSNVVRPFVPFQSSIGVSLVDRGQFGSSTHDRVGSGSREEFGKDSILFSRSVVNRHLFRDFESFTHHWNDSESRDEPR